MDKEILEWINGQIRSRARDLSLIKKCGGPFCRNPDPLKEDLKILNRIKEELGAKGKSKRAKPTPQSHGQGAAHESADKETDAILSWLADQVADRRSYIDDYDYYAKNSKSYADACMLMADDRTATLVDYLKLQCEKAGIDLKILQAIKKSLIDNLYKKKPKEKRILDDVERRYLKSVVRPFKNDAVWVMLAYDWAYGTKVHLEICCCINNIKSWIQLPPFTPGTMYKHMEIGKQYTLKELGLDD